MQARLGEAPPLPLAAFSSQQAPGFPTELSEVGRLGGRVSQKLPVPASALRPCAPSRSSGYRPASCPQRLPFRSAVALQERVREKPSDKGPGRVYTPVVLSSGCVHQ